VKKIIYWSPYLGHIGTKKSTLNSAKGLSIYGKDKFDVRLINALGEWNDVDEIKTLSFFKNLYNKLPQGGFFKSRISYSIIFLLSILPLYKFLKKDKPDYIIAHLITSLPIFLFKIFKFETKLILRISGYPKLNLIRKFFWKLCSKNIHLITCPSIELKNQLRNLDIFENKKIVVLYDSVINIKEVNNQKNALLSDNIMKSNYLLAIGRLTKQKNFNLLINAFYEFNKINNDYKLLIIGEGEENKKIINKINHLKLEHKIILLGFKQNVYKYLKNSKAFILSSLWEEMGFVIIEAASCNTLIISSDCPNGPSEFLEYGKAGYLFNNNSVNDLVQNLIKFDRDEKNIKYNKILQAKKNVKKFTIFNHYKELKKILDNK
jgi:glycosyltransferase involved in cell wall biosynthesis